MKCDVLEVLFECDDDDDDDEIVFGFDGEEEYKLDKNMMLGYIFEYLSINKHIKRLCITNGDVYGSKTVTKSLRKHFNLLITLLNKNQFIKLLKFERFRYFEGMKDEMIEIAKDHLDVNFLFKFFICKESEMDDVHQMNKYINNVHVKNLLKDVNESLVRVKKYWIKYKKKKKILK